MKKILVSALLISAILLSACSNSNNTSSKDDSTTSKVDTVPTEPVDPTKGATDSMYTRAIKNEGNLSRLAAVMKKATNGEEITVGFIGGSITQGSAATNSEKCYASLVAKWWTETFPDAKINFVNAGIGATDSYIGVHRIDRDLLSKKPDVVMIEFSVNDTRADLNFNSYDSIVRKALDCETNPAVMLLFMVNQDGSNLQTIHNLVGLQYDLPIISYADAVSPEVKAGTLDWNAIAADSVHPNDTGHALVADIVTKFLKSVKDKVDTIDTSNLSFSKEAATADKYKDGTLLDNTTITPIDAGTFKNNSSFYQFPHSWKTTESGTIKFVVECTNLGIIYLRTNDGKSGSYDVYVDGEIQNTLVGNFPNGWGNYAESAEVYTGDTKKKITVEIKPNAATTEFNFNVLGLLVS